MRFRDVARVVPEPLPPGPRGPGVVWQCWWQGVDKAPAVVKVCLESVKAHLPGRRVVVVDSSNFRDYVDLPEKLLSGVASGRLSHQFLSDYLRVALLSRHGGAWIDATVYLTGQVDDVCLDSDFFVFSSPFWQVADLDKIDGNLLGLLRFFSSKPSSQMFGSSWWMAARPESAVIRVVKALLDAYLEAEDHVVDYLIIYDLLSLAILENPACREEWRRMAKRSTVETQLLRSILLEPYDAEVMSRLKALSPVHKLAYRYAHVPTGSFIRKLLEAPI